MKLITEYLHKAGHDFQLCHHRQPAVHEHESDGKSEFQCVILENGQIADVNKTVSVTAPTPKATVAVKLKLLNLQNFCSLVAFNLDSFLHEGFFHSPNSASVFSRVALCWHNG